MLIDGVWEDPQTVEAFRRVGRVLAESTFSTPVVIELCDEYMDVKKSISISE